MHTEYVSALYKYAFKYNASTTLNLYPMFFRYVNYVLRRVDMLLHHKVKPILVFDGGYLPSKSQQEASRRK